MSKTLYLSDLDGTLLNKNANLSPKTLEIINNKTAEGMLFGYATARSIVSALRVAAGLAVSVPVITHNGVFIIDTKTGKYLESCIMDKGKILPIIEYMKTESVPVLVYALIDGRERVSWICGMENTGIQNYLSDRAGDIRLRPVDNWEQLFCGEVFYFTVIEEEAKAKKLFESCCVSDYCRYTLMPDVYAPDEWWTEIYRSDATKATAAQKLKKILGADKIVSFGDLLNDIPLFEVSDYCYAVENAHADLKKIATGVIGANYADGVALWISNNT